MRDRRNKVTTLLYLTLSTILTLLYACGDAQYSSSETGSIAFSVEWRGLHKEVQGATQQHWTVLLPVSRR
jgi:hypothetical protein